MKLIEGETPIGTVKNKKDNKEYTLYFGNVIKLPNGKTMKAREDVYKQRFTEFFKEHRNEIETEVSKKDVAVKTEIKPEEKAEKGKETPTAKETPEAEEKKQEIPEEQLEATQPLPIITDGDLASKDEPKEVKPVEEVKKTEEAPVKEEKAEEPVAQKSASKPDASSANDEKATEKNENATDKKEAEPTKPQVPAFDVEAFEAKFDSLQSSLKTEVTNSVKEQIEDVGTNFEELTKKYDEVNESVKELSKSISKINDSVTTLSKKKSKEIRQANVEGGSNKFKPLMIGSLIVALLSVGCTGIVTFGFVSGKFSVAPASKNDSTISVITVNKDIPAGTQITEDDVEESEVSADEYSDLADGTLVGADGSSSTNYAELWSAKNKIVGKYASESLKEGDYLYKTSYTAISDGQKVITMDIDGEKVSMPVTITTEGTSDINMYAIMTTKDADGKTSNIAFDLGKITLSGKELKDIQDSNGTSKLADIIKEAEKNQKAAEDEKKAEKTDDK